MGHRINASMGLAICLMSVSLPHEAWAGPPYVRRTKMFDIPQTQRPEWGGNWCAPTAVGNSLAWYAQEFGGDYVKLVKLNGTGAALSAEGVIDTLGFVDMHTNPATGTNISAIAGAKSDYIRRHGLEGKMTVESMVGVAQKFVSDGSFAGYSGTRVTKQWLKEQYELGQDVEFGVGYYEKRADGKWYRTGGHAQVFVGDAPGLGAGGHMFTLSDILDPFNSNVDTDFQVSFTDPGRDDLTGQFGAIAHDQYFLTDYAGVTWFNTASTYNVVYQTDPFGLGIPALLLDGYQGLGDFVGDGVNRDKLTVLEGGWAESPAPSAVSVLIMGALAGLRRRRHTLAATCV